MRLGFGLVVVTALILAACSDRPVELASQWGCGPIEGIGALNGATAPKWILVGEFTETAEAPAAVANIACHLATRETKLFVGVTDYLGGDTDAEKRMRDALDWMIAKGAPIIVEKIGGEDHPYTIRNKSKAEQAWAQTLTEKVAASGAHRALLFVPRADAIAAPIVSTGDRFAGYSPMPVFLEGGVVSLEVAPNPIVGETAPAIRIHREITNGFHGQLALTSLTRPMVALAMPSDPEPGDTSSVFPPDTQEAKNGEADEILREAQERIQRVLDQGSMSGTLDPGVLPEDLMKDLPEFEAE